MRNGMGGFHIADVNFNLQATLRSSLRFSRRFQWPLLGYAFMAPAVLYRRSQVPTASFI